jgi:hypothetical protein
MPVEGFILAIYQVTTKFVCIYAIETRGMAYISRLECSFLVMYKCKDSPKGHLYITHIKLKLSNQDRLVYATCIKSAAIRAVLQSAIFLQRQSGWLG